MYNEICAIKICTILKTARVQRIDEYALSNFIMKSNAMEDPYLIFDPYYVKS